MTESEWIGLKQYLDDHGIEYKTEICCIAGPVSSFMVILPPVTCYHNDLSELENAYPEIIDAWNELWDELKGIVKS
jgi:hypothetical protein